MKSFLFAALISQLSLENEAAKGRNLDGFF